MSKSLFATLDRRYSKRDVVLSRRAMLQASLAASAGLLISCSTGGPKTDRQAKRVIVVGAGFGGLACAHELRSAGYQVTVLEARNRVGGRVLSFNAKNGNEFIPGRNIEGGGELVGLNHPTWQGYAQQFKLNLIEVTENEDFSVPIIMRGHRLTDEEGEKLYEDMDTVLAAITEDAKDINAELPWLSSSAKEWDATTTASRLARVEAPELALYAAMVELSSNNGVSADRQSYLGNLAAVKGGGLEKYWTDSETHRCEGGNQSLAFALARAVGDRNIRLATAVKSIDVSGSKARVTLGSGEVLEADEVVLAVPPSVWRDIAITPGLPRVLTPQMGIATKYLAHVKDRFWEKDEIGPDAFTDEIIPMTWDGTDNQPGDAPGCLIGFTGGPGCAKLREQANPKDAAKQMMGKIYPGFADAFVQDRFMDWPGEKLTGAGYSFPAPGQVTTVGPILHQGLGRLHFAGEHASYQYCGYMEGALYSGASVAKRLAQRDGVLAMV